MQKTNTEEYFDDLDLLEANIDPLDTKSLRKKEEILADLEMKKVKLRIKYVKKFAL